MNINLFVSQDKYTRAMANLLEKLVKRTITENGWNTMDKDLIVNTRKELRGTEFKEADILKEYIDLGGLLKKDDGTVDQTTMIPTPEQQAQFAVEKKKKKAKDKKRAKQTEVTELEVRDDD